MLFFSWNNSEETRQEVTAKTQGKVKTRQQGRGNKKTRKKRERERERVTKRSERNQGKRKGDTKGRHWEMNQNNLFQGKKQCFCKETQTTQKTKKGWRPTAQKHTCNAALPPIPRRMQTKEKNTQIRKGGVRRGPLQVPKKMKKPSALQPRGHFWQGPENPRKKKWHGRAPPSRQNCVRRGDTAKNALFKTSSVLQPQGFLTFETQLRQNFEHRTVQNSNTQKKVSSRRVRKIKPFRHAKGARRGTETRNCS